MGWQRQVCLEGVQEADVLPRACELQGTYSLWCSEEKSIQVKSLCGFKGHRWTEVTTRGGSGHWVETGWDRATGNSGSSQRLVPYGPRQRESQKDQSEAKGYLGCYKFKEEPRRKQAFRRRDGGALQLAGLDLREQRVK